MASLNETADPNPPVSVPSPTVLDTLRTAKMGPLGDGSVKSGMNKKPRGGPVFASSLGLTDDEHDLTFHGGVDKAIHHYSTDNYYMWRERFPDPKTAAKFVPGGFGENIAARGFTERNVCIGDQVRIGPSGKTTVGGENGVLLEVSLPRQPCFKLNLRFGIKNFAPKTTEAARTGWYYRVLEPGFIQAGDEIKVLTRPHPQWTIERLQFYLHKKQDEAILEKLVQVPQMGKECRDNMNNKLEKLREAAAPKAVEVFRPFKVASKRLETSKVMHLILESIAPHNKASNIAPGSHVRLRLPNGLSRSYSVVTGTTDRFELGVARESNGRGGSEYLHDNVAVGDLLDCGPATESLKGAPMASQHILIAGGIGITAFASMVALFNAINFDYFLHYAVPSEEEAAFKNYLDKVNAHYRLYDKSKGERLQIRELLKNRTWGSHVFVCGPQRMIDDVITSAKAEGMLDEEVHFESFHADISGDPFTATVVEEDKTAEVRVGEEESLLEVMRKAGFECGSSCEAGNCGTCRVSLKAGKVEHRGKALNDEDKKTAMLSCVSRGLGHITIEL